MKALEILKACRERGQKRAGGLDLDEAIKELEAINLTRREWYQKGFNEAMKQRTCEGCIREEEDMQDPHCAFCSRVCSDNYEAKDNA